jgi:predicted nucleic acid-binding protein
VDIDVELDAGAAIVLARRHRLTFYDAVYLELAIRRNLPLASFDRDLFGAARIESVPQMVGP